MEQERVVLKNEFATVEVIRDDTANGSRLLIKDLQTGRQVYLDPLELEALTRAPHSAFARWLDPDLALGRARRRSAAHEAVAASAFLPLSSVRRVDAQLNQEALVAGLLEHSPRVHTFLHYVPLLVGHFKMSPAAQHSAFRIAVLGKGVVLFVGTHKSSSR